MASSCCGGRAFAGPAHGHRFDGAAQVEQVIDEVFRQAAARQPADDLRIEEVPAPHRQHPRTDLRPDFEHAFGDQGLDGFANDRAADTQLFAEVGFDLERLTRLDLPGSDPAAQPIDRRRVKTAGHGHLKAVRDGCPR